jgi:hypothetical protein
MHIQRRNTLASVIEPALAALADGIVLMMPRFPFEMRKNTISVSHSTQKKILND